MKIVDLRDYPEYINLLAGWHHEEWKGLNPGQTLAMRIQKMQAYLASDFVPSTFIALSDNDVVLGSAAIIDSDMETKPHLTPWLASVFVAPAFRNNGVASRLIQSVITASSRHNIEKLYLFTPDQAHFYAKRGWQTLSHEFYRDHDVTVMQYLL